MTLREQIQTRRDNAQKLLDAALLSGDTDTDELRTAVRDADKALAELDASEAEASQSETADAQAQVGERAAEIVQAAQDELRERLHVLIADITLPDVSLPLSIARDIQQAADEVAQAQKKEAAARDEYDKASERLQALKSERQDIISRRAAGKRSNDDEARLVTLAADIEGLEPLVKRAGDAWRSATAHAAAMRERYSAASGQWQLAIKTEYQRVVTALAATLDTAFVRVAEQSRNRKENPSNVVGHRPSLDLKKFVQGY